MPNKNLLLAVFLSFSCLSLYSQTIIDYENWTGSSGCNIFSSSTNVDATTNGSSTTIAHESNIGQPTYAGSPDKAVLLDCYAVIDNNGNTTGYMGTEYRITYTFKANYSYSIVINARVINSSGTGSNASLRILANNGGNSTSTSCSGPATISPNPSGNLYRSNTPSGSFQNYTFSYSAFSSQHSLLNLAAVPPINSGNQTILIRKITITETAAPPSFTLPSTSSVSCTAATTITATTASNPLSLTITDYTWDLGTTPNGWLYNGSAAPQTVSTGTTNSISLTANSLTPKNVKATVTAGGGTYNTNTTTVSVSHPSMSINGPNDFCNNNVYSVTNLPSGATVSWSASPSGVVYFTNASGSQVTVNKSNAGIINLIASVTTSCSTYTVNSSSITVGVPLNGGIATSPDQGLTLKSWAEGYNLIWEDSYVYWGLQGTSASQYSLVGGSVSWNSSNYYPNVDFYLGSGSYATFKVDVTSGSCSESLYYTFVPISNPYSYYSLAPNPVSSDLTIYVDEEKLKNQKIEKSPDQVIQQVIIIDKLGNVVTQQKYPTTTKKVRLSVSGLTPDMYIAQIFNGKKLTSIKFMKK